MTATAPRVPIETYEAVKQIPVPDVVEWLSVDAARERHKHACVWCDSSDAMHVHDDGVKCFSCGKHGSGIDLVMAKYGIQAPEAVLALAERFNILVLPTAPGSQRPAPVPARARTTAPKPRPVADPTADAETLARQEVYGALIEALTLTAKGHEYLRARGFAAVDRIPVDFRSIDGRAEWVRVGQLLVSRFGQDRVRDTLTPRREKRKPNEPERHGLPFGGRRPALVLPYRHRGAVVALRFRQLEEPREKHHRYRDLGARKSPVPFNADALDELAGHDLHICEGELDAYALALVGHGLHVIGVPGVGQIPGYAKRGPIPAWLSWAGKARRILCWYDPDKAGGEGAGRLLEALRDANGWNCEEARRRCRRVAVHEYPGADVNDLYRAGHLPAVLSRLGVSL